MALRTDRNSALLVAAVVIFIPAAFMLSRRLQSNDVVSGIVHGVLIGLAVTALAMLAETSRRRALRG